MPVLEMRRASRGRENRETLGSHSSSDYVLPA